MLHHWWLVHDRDAADSSSSLDGERGEPSASASASTSLPAPATAHSPHRPTLTSAFCPPIRNVLPQRAHSSCGSPANQMQINWNWLKTILYVHNAHLETFNFKYIVQYFVMRDDYNCTCLSPLARLITAKYQLLSQTQKGHKAFMISIAGKWNFEKKTVYDRWYKLFYYVRDIEIITINGEPPTPLSPLPMIIG